MANAKNTIQNIPLTGELCLNKLKTDVKQFEGYNEKNTTVFGSELTPLWVDYTKTVSQQDSYTVFNSKGESYAIAPDAQGGYHFYKHGLEIVTNDNNNYVVPFTTKIDLPIDALWGGMFLVSKNDTFTVFFELYLSSDYKLYRRLLSNKNQPLPDKLHTAINEEPWELLDTVESAPGNKFFLGATGGYANNAFILAILYKDVNDNAKLYCNYMSNVVDGVLIPETQSFDLPHSLNDSDYIITINENQPYNKEVYVVNTGSSTKNGRVGVNDTPHYYLATYTGSWSTELAEVTSYKPMSISSTSDSGGCFYGNQEANLSNDGLTIGWTSRTADFSPYVFRKCFFEDNSLHSYTYVDEIYPYWNPGYYATGHDGSGFIPGLFKSGKQWGDPCDFICQDNNLVTITYGGVHINTPTSFSDNYVTVSKVGNGHSLLINYKSGNDWYCFMALEPRFAELFNSVPRMSTDFMKSLVIDNRYILLLNTNAGDTYIYDIEEDGIIYKGSSLGYVSTAFPYVSDGDIQSNTTGCIYAGGFNAGFEVNNANFVGYLANPNVMTCFPGTVANWSYTNDSNSLKNIQNYLSIGDAVQSAEYVGKDPQFIGTTYPIDPNGNIILPFSLNSKIITGYSNNDMIKINDTAYPLMYYNTNQKIFAYHLLSSMENIEGLFSLQGQQYTYDNNSIYNISFQDGIISNVNPVCYKKHLTFLGTLPTAAIFYSFFNKSFYQFTGDAIVQKMFEANDINEIYSVSQNPATQSIWICTDTGIYVMSDTDMFRLDYVVRNPVFFQENSAIFLPFYEYEGNAHVISFYRIKDSATPKSIKLATKYYGLGSELKATFDCWYIRLHSETRENGKLKVKVNTITDTSFESEEKTFELQKSMYDDNDQIYIKYQPKYQSAVAIQLELESDVPIYQISLGVNQTDAITQQTKFNF